MTVVILGLHTGKNILHALPTVWLVKKKSDLVGAHVKKVNTYDDAWYITPLCKACNNKADLEFDVIRDNLIEVTACNK